MVMPTLDKTNYFKRPQASKNKMRDKFKHRVYASDRWRNLRLQKLANDPLCEKCLEQGLYVPAEDVHHIESFAEHPDDWQRWAYCYENLQSLCKSCHGKEHRKHQEYGGEEI